MFAWIPKFAALVLATGGAPDADEVARHCGPFAIAESIGLGSHRVCVLESDSIDECRSPLQRRRKRASIRSAYSRILTKCYLETAYRVHECQDQLESLCIALPASVPAEYSDSQFIRGPPRC
jgi:hypothetical protein